MRIPVASVYDPRYDYIAVVCSDGSVWSTSACHKNNDWEECAPIPGSQRAQELGEEAR